MITVVIPTIGRPSLRATLAALADVPVVVADDRPGAAEPLEVSGGVRVVRSGGRGPAAARNAGWRAADTPWVAFLDDDVVPSPGWARAAWKDLVDLPEDVGGSQGRITVPLPSGRRPTDGERHTAGLVDADWPTADMAYRRSALERVGGFDERFPRAYREDADLALRVRRAGYRLVKGGAGDGSPGARRRLLGQRQVPARQRRRRPDAPPARAGLARGDRRPGPPAPPRPHDGLRRRRSRPGHRLQPDRSPGRLLSLEARQRAGRGRGLAGGGRGGCS
ncbi:glycosyltransferase family 2 protein [Nonomuraea ferruginea]